jgi:hypothetical protein
LLTVFLLYDRAARKRSFALQRDQSWLASASTETPASVGGIIDGVCGDGRGDPLRTIEAAMQMRSWIMIGVVVGTLAGAAVWAAPTRKPAKDYIILAIEDMPDDQIKIHISKPGQEQKVMEFTVGVTEEEVRVSDKDQPRVTTTLIKGEGRGKLVIRKWLDGSGTVPSKEAEPDDYR